MKRLLLVVLLLAVPGALAHAEPYQSDPAPGARLEDAPHIVRVAFTERVFSEGSWIRVLDSQGERVDLNDLSIQGEQRPVMTLSLRPIPDGAYRIAWQTYSLTDGHTVRGSIGFAVGAFEAPGSESEASTNFDAWPSAARFLLYGGFTAALGALAYSLWMRVPVQARFLQGGAALALAGTLILSLDTGRGTGLAFGEYAVSEGGLAMVTRTLLLGAILLLTLIWTVIRPGLRSANWILGGLWLLAAWQTAQWGHISQQGTWGVVVEWVHLVAAATWIGSLTIFFVALRRASDPLADGRRYGTLAASCVTLIALSGVVLVLALIGDVVRTSPSAVFTDSWTWFLLVKVAAFATMLGAAAFNRFGYLSNDPPRWLAPWLPKASLQSTVRFEAATAIVALLAAGMLLSVSPPQNGGDPGPAVELAVTGDAFNGLLEVAPAPNVNSSHVFRFYVESIDEGEPVLNNTCGRQDCLRARWAMDEDAGTEQQSVAIPEGGGWWRIEAVLFTQPGLAQVSLDVQTGYVYLDTLEFEPFVVGSV